AEADAERAVRIAVPALEGRGHRLAARLRDGQRQLGMGRGRGRRGQRSQAEASDQTGTHRRCQQGHAESADYTSIGREPSWATSIADRGTWVISACSG